jgi:hypothetical protein
MTEVTGVWQHDTTFEASSKGESASFDKTATGGLRVEVDGFNREVFYMSAAQFEAFKAWVMEN